MEDKFSVKSQGISIEGAGSPDDSQKQTSGRLKAINDNNQRLWVISDSLTKNAIKLDDSLQQVYDNAKRVKAQLEKSLWDTTDLTYKDLQPYMRLLDNLYNKLEKFLHIIPAGTNNRSIKSDVDRQNNLSKEMDAVVDKKVAERLSVIENKKTKTQAKKLEQVEPDIQDKKQNNRNNDQRYITDNGEYDVHKLSGSGVYFMDHAHRKYEKGAQSHVDTIYEKAQNGGNDIYGANAEAIKYGNRIYTEASIKNEADAKENVPLTGEEIYASWKRTSDYSRLFPMAYKDRTQKTYSNYEKEDKDAATENIIGEVLNPLKDLIANDKNSYTIDEKAKRPQDRATVSSKFGLAIGLIKSLSSIPGIDKTALGNASLHLDSSKKDENKQSTEWIKQELKVGGLKSVAQLLGSNFVGKTGKTRSEITLGKIGALPDYVQNDILYQIQSKKLGATYPYTNKAGQRDPYSWWNKIEKKQSLAQNPFHGNEYNETSAKDMFELMSRFKINGPGSSVWPKENKQEFVKIIEEAARRNGKEQKESGAYSGFTEEEYKRIEELFAYVYNPNHPKIYPTYDDKPNVGEYNTERNRGNKIIKQNKIFGNISDPKEYLASLKEEFAAEKLGEKRIGGGLNSQEAIDEYQIKKSAVNANIEEWNKLSDSGMSSVNLQQLVNAKLQQAIDEAANKQENVSLNTQPIDNTGNPNIAGGQTPSVPGSANFNINWGDLESLITRAINASNIGDPTIVSAIKNTSNDIGIIQGKISTGGINIKTGSGSSNGTSPDNSQDKRAVNIPKMTAYVENTQRQLDKYSKYFAQDHGEDPSDIAKQTKAFNDIEPILIRLRDFLKIFADPTSTDKAANDSFKEFNKTRPQTDYLLNQLKIPYDLYNFKESNMTSMGIGIQKASKKLKLPSAFSSNKALSGLFGQNVQQNEDVITKLNDTFSAFKQAQNIDDAKEALQQFNDALKTAGVVAEESGSNLSSWISKIGKEFVHLTSQKVAMLAIRSLTKAVRSAITYIKQLDDALVQAQVVRGYTANQVKELADAYNNLAKQTGSTTIEVANATLAYLRQGKEQTQALALAEQSIKLSKLAGIESADATNYLTAIMNAFHVSAEETVTIVDKLIAVDNNAATSTAELAQALSKTSVSASVAGVSLDELIGMAGTISEVTRMGAEEVGTGLRQMFARMGTIKLGNLDETGQGLNDVETSLRLVGISTRNASGDFKDMGDVLDEVGANWDSYSSTEQNAIAVSLGGTRQREKVLTLLENYDRVLELTEIAENSTGLSTERFGYYLDSVAAKTNELTAAWQGLITALTGGEGSAIYTLILQVLTTIVNLMAKLNFAAWIPILVLLTKVLSSLSSTLGVGSAALKIWKYLFSDLPLQIVKSIASMKGYTVATKVSTAATKIDTAAKEQNAKAAAVQAAASLGFIAILTALAWVISLVVQYFQKQNEIVADSISKYNEAKDSVSEYKDKITELKKEYDGLLDKGSARAKQLEEEIRLNNLLESASEYIAEETKHTSTVTRLHYRNSADGSPMTSSWKQALEAGQITQEEYDDEMKSIEENEKHEITWNVSDKELITLNTAKFEKYNEAKEKLESTISKLKQGLVTSSEYGKVYDEYTSALSDAMSFGQEFVAAKDLIDYELENYSSLYPQKVIDYWEEISTSITDEFEKLVTAEGGSIDTTQDPLVAISNQESGLSMLVNLMSDFVNKGKIGVNTLKDMATSTDAMVTNLKTLLVLGDDGMTTTMDLLKDQIQSYWSDIEKTYQERIKAKQKIMDETTDKTSDTYLVAKQAADAYYSDYVSMAEYYNDQFEKTVIDAFKTRLSTQKSLISEYYDDLKTEYTAYQKIINSIDTNMTDEMTDEQASAIYSMFFDTASGGSSYEEYSTLIAKREELKKDLDKANQELTFKRNDNGTWDSVADEEKVTTLDAQIKTIDDKLKKMSVSVVTSEEQYSAVLDKIKKTEEEIGETKLVSLELQKQQLTVAKAQQALEDAQKSKTVRTYKEGVGWIYVADEKEINTAKENLKTEQKKLRKAQLDSINEFYQTKLDQYNLEKELLTSGMTVNEDTIQNYINKQGITDKDGKSLQWSKMTLAEKLKLSQQWTGVAQDAIGTMRDTDLITYQTYNNLAGISAGTNPITNLDGSKIGAEIGNMGNLVTGISDKTDTIIDAIDEQTETISDVAGGGGGLRVHDDFASLKENIATANAALDRAEAGLQGYSVETIMNVDPSQWADVFPYLVNPEEKVKAYQEARQNLIAATSAYKEAVDSANATANAKSLSEISSAAEAIKESYTSTLNVYNNINQTIGNMNNTLAEIDAMVKKYGEAKAAQFFKGDVLGYAEGGLIDYTGNAKVHGSMDSPEVIMNNQQAARVLYNLSTMKTASTDKSSDVDNSILVNTMYVKANDGEEIDTIVNSARRKLKITKV